MKSKQSFNVSYNQNIFNLQSEQFDKGDAVLADFLTMFKNESESLSTCGKTPAFVGANIVPHANSALLGAGVPQLEDSKVFTMGNGELVGVIGIDTRNKTMQSSQPDPGTILLDEVETTKSVVNTLTSAGVNKIILLTHIGYNNDQNLLATLEGVDVVVGGDSHSLLGSDLTEVVAGRSTIGPYATVIEKGDGTKTCVVQAWDYSKLIGNLEIDFDDDGNVISCGGSPVFPLNPDKFTVRDANPRYDMSESDASLVVTSLFERSGGQAQAFGADVAAAADLATYSAEVDVLSRQVIATATELISLEAGGYESGACDLVAQAFLLHPLVSSDVAIQNRGGCRANIAEVCLGY